MSPALRVILSTTIIAVVFVGLLFPQRLISLIPEVSQISEPPLPHTPFEPIEEVASSTLAVQATSSVVFLGDVMLARHVEYLMSVHGFEYPYQRIGWSTTTPQYVVANFEAAIPEIHKKTPNFNLVFSVATSALPALREAGVTHVSLANNHSYDHGAIGFLHTKSALQAVGIETFGTYSGVSSSSVTELMIGENQVGILALHLLARAPTKAELELVLTALSQRTDIQVAYVHWGDEYSHIPNSSQREFAEVLSQLGVDLVIGHHPHVVQSVERIGETLVFYSLGNFIFDQYFSAAVQEMLVLTLEQRESGQLAIVIDPYESTQTPAQPRPMSSEERENYLGWLAAQSDKVLFEELARGEVTSLAWLATSSKTAMMSE